MAIENEETSSQAIRLYRDLADWCPLLTPVGDYAEEAAFYRTSIIPPAVFPHHFPKLTDSLAAVWRDRVLRLRLFTTPRV